MVAISWHQILVFRSKFEESTLRNQHFAASTTYSILKEAISVFLGEKIDEELKLSIQEIGKSNFKMPLNAHHFLIHQYGNYSELTFHITLKGDMSLSEANSIAVKYKALIENKHDIGVTIHIDTKESFIG